MSMILMAQALKTKVGNPLRKLVLIKLADNANDEGLCWPSHSNIAEHCEMSKRSVINHINALSEASYLTIIPRIKDNKKQSNHYQLHFEKVGISSESPALPKQISSESPARGSESPALPSSESPAHRTYHSSEPIKEPIKKNIQKKSEFELPNFISESQWEEMLQIKKTATKKALSERGKTQLITSLNEINQAGYSMEQVLNLWSEHPHWMTMKLEYMENKLSNGNYQRHAGVETQREYQARTTMAERLTDTSWAESL